MSLKMSERKYLLHLVESREDAVITQENVCVTCAQKKLHTVILKSFNITADEMRALKKYNTRAVGVICECKNESTTFSE
jgi:hypothetical protein